MAKHTLTKGKPLQTASDKAAASDVRSAVKEASHRSTVWAWLSNESTQRTLGFIGAGIAAVIAAAWPIYVHFTENAGPPKPAASVGASVATPYGGISAGGDVRATAASGGIAVIASGPVSIGITLEQYQEEMKKREQELRQESANTIRTDKDRIALLEQQIAGAQAQSGGQGFDQYKAVLASASRSLAQLGDNIPAEELNKARAALALGDAAQAEALFKKAQLGDDKTRAADAAYQLGQLAESRIDYAMAVKYFTEAVELQPDNPLYLSKAGIMNHTLGRYTDAEIFYEKSLTIRKKELGPEHPDVGWSLNNLAALYKDQGKYAKAEPLYQQSLAIWKKALGPEHPDVAMSLNNLAALYHAQGDYARAEPLYQQSLAIRDKALGPEHPDVAMSLNNLAALYKDQGDYTRAEPLYQRSLAIWKKTLGPEHPNVAMSLNNLAALYHAEGDYARAEPLYQQSLAIRKKVLGPEHRDVGWSLNNLARLYMDEGDYAKAEPLYQQTLAIWTKALGPEHPDMATVLENYAELLAHMKRDKEAADMQARAKKIREKSVTTSPG